MENLRANAPQIIKMVGLGPNFAIESDKPRIIVLTGIQNLEESKMGAMQRANNPRLDLNPCPVREKR